MKPRTITVDDIKELALRHPLRNFNTRSASNSIVAWFVRLNWRKTERHVAIISFLDYVGIYRRETYRVHSFVKLCIEKWPLEPALTRIYDALRFHMFGAVIAELLEVATRFPDQLEALVVDAMEENRRLARIFQTRLHEEERQYIVDKGKGSLLAKAMTRISMQDQLSCSSCPDTSHQQSTESLPLEPSERLQAS